MRFRFDTLLQVHKNKENLLQKELGDILAHKKKQQDKEGFLQNTRQVNIKQINGRMTQDLKVDTYVLYNNFFTGNHLNRNRQETIISEIDARAKSKRGELVEARRKRRTLEILKERDLKAYNKKLSKIEIEIMDETASNHWRLNS